MKSYKIMASTRFFILCLGVALLGGMGAAHGEDTFSVSSPDGTVEVSLTLNKGMPYWSLKLDDNALLSRGRLGVTAGGAKLHALKTVATDQRANRETVETTWGKFASYDDHYNELTWTLREKKGKKRNLGIVVRVYDLGVGLRYVFPEDGGWDETFKWTSDLTEFRFEDEGTAWGYRREYDPIGPQSLSAFHKGKRAELPMTIRFREDAYVGVLEGAIYDHAPFRLDAVKGNKTAFRAKIRPSEMKAGSSTSWRVLLLGRQPGDLLTSPVLHCLNPPVAVEDTSWIKPGLAFWDWRAWGAKTEDGFTYALDMPSWRRFIDYASMTGVRYLVLDASWYGPEFEATSDPRVSRDHLVIQPDPDKPHLERVPAPDPWEDPIDIPALIQYAKPKGVGIILYFNDIARLNYPFEETLALFHEWGAAGIKYGFMKGKDQTKVLDTRKIVEMCAKYELLCNFHDGPVAPSGDERMYPNYVSREFCHSQSDAMRVFGPSGFCEQVFVNMIAGPLDMCNGLYTLKDPASIRPKIFKNLETTIAAETARVLITYSGMSILPDCPEAYEQHKVMFDFIRRLPMDWDETLILNASIGEFITTARRSGEEWFIASATDEEPRTLPVRLDFLKPGKAYIATLYEDAPDAHFQTNREAYRVREIKVTADDTIEAAMVPGGGHSIYIRAE